MVKKVIASLLLAALVGFALWQGVLSEEAANENDLTDYKDLNIKDGQAEPVTGETYGLEPGKEAPPFTLTNLEGKAVKLSDYKGKKVILNFWATWCPPCKEEMPDMQKFHEKYGKEVQILAVNLTSSEGSKEGIKSFLNEHHLTFQVLLDEEDTVATKSYRVVTIPTTYFIDEEGKIAKRINGPMNLEQMETFASKSN
ncbi:TlpA family protein disulfide reductase [Priestia megaterium]|nr:TlpA family protein disulfide reductase [Priestia megaterium]